MSNGINPYGLLGSQQAIIDTLAEQKNLLRESKTAGQEHMTGMKEDFTKKRIATDRRIKEIEEKERKKHPLSFLKNFLPPEYQALLDTVSFHKDVKFEKEKAADIKGIDYLGGYGGTFLGETADVLKSQKEEQDRMRTKQLEDIGPLDYITKGVSGYLAGKGTEKLLSGLSPSGIEIPEGADFTAEDLTRAQDYIGKDWAPDDTISSSAWDFAKSLPDKASGGNFLEDIISKIGGADLGGVLTEDEAGAGKNWMFLLNQLLGGR